MADEGTPLLVVPELATDRARAGRARAAFFTIFVTVCFFHFLLDGGLAFAEPGSGGSQSGSALHVVVSPPCCNSGSLVGRRATEASPACIPCPGIASIATAYSVPPSAPPPPQCPPHPTLPHSNFDKTIGVKRWPAPTTPPGSPTWYRDDCGNDNAAGPYRWKPENRPGKGQGEWRRDMGAINTAGKHAHAEALGMTVTQVRQAQHAANGETSNSARMATRCER